MKDLEVLRCCQSNIRRVYFHCSVCKISKLNWEYPLGWKMHISIIYKAQKLSIGTHLILDDISWIFWMIHSVFFIHILSRNSGWPISIYLKVINLKVYEYHQGLKIGRFAHIKYSAFKKFKTDWFPLWPLKLYM